MKNKLLKFFKNFATFFVIVTLSFSNIPFNLLTGAIDGYVKTSNIVDQSWHLSQEGNVVDNFIPSYRNKNIALLDKLAGNLKIKEAHAAASYVGGVVCSRAGSTGTVLTCSLTALTGGSNTSPSQDDVVIAVVGTGSAADRAIGVTNVGYTELPELYANGTTYDTNLSVSWKVMGAIPDSSVTFSASGSTADAISAVVHVWRGIDTGTPFDVTNQSITGTGTGRPNPPPITPVTSGATVIAIGAGAAGTGAVYTAVGLANFITKTSVDTNDSMTGMGSFAWSSGMYDSAQFAGGTANAVDSWASYTLALRPAPPVTTISDFVSAEPGNSTIAPAGTGLVDSFGLVVNTGTDTVTAATVGLAAGMGQYVQTVAITNDGDTVTYCSASPSGDSASLSTCGIPVTTTNTQFKIKVTAKAHASLPAPAGGSYAMTATVTGFISTNGQAGTDPGSSTLTIDNASPNGATSVSGVAGTNANTINWTTSNSADFNTTSGSVILRWAAASAGAEVPLEGSAYTAGNTISTATVACVISSTVSAVLSKIDGTGGSTGCTTIALTNGQAYTYKAFQRDVNGNYDVGVTIGTLTPAGAITVASYFNTTEPALDYVASCTGCGARIGGGAGFRQSITITGSGFGADPGAANRSTASNNIKIGTHQIVATNVTAWSDTSITFLTDSDIAGDTDTDWGSNFGGALALVVTAGGGSAAGLNFYVFPQVISVTQPIGFGADTAREYDALDTDGVITLNGTRFGSSQGPGSVTIVAQAAAINSWTNTAIGAQVPPAIADTTNTGSISMTQGTGGSSKTSTYLNTLRVLPRITSFNPTSASEGTAVTVNGNHFCQSGTCPVAFSAGDKVTFTSGVIATVFTSWSATAIVTAVPTGAITGDVVMTSNTAYTSNASSFTVLSNTPAPPTSLSQWKDSAFTQAIAIAGMASTTPLYLTMSMSVPSISGGTLYSQIEYKPIGTPFVCTGTTVCASDALQGPAGFAGPGPVDCTVSNCAVSVTPTDNVYHWQARVKHTKSTVDYYSSWVSFDGGNPESSTDFQIDSTQPAVTGVSSGSPGTNSATITWSTLGETSTSQVQYNTTGTFASNCSTNNDCTAIDATLVYSPHTTALSNLSSGTLYYYRVRSKDAAGNETIDVTNTFTTSSVSTPAKTIKSYINGATGVVSGATPYYFTVNVPETAPLVQNAYVEVFGVVSGGAGTVTVQANGVSARAYDVSAVAPTFYRFLYKIPSPEAETNLNLNDVTPCTNDSTPGVPPETPPCNKLIITPATVSMYVLSAKIITTYAYTP